MTRLASKQMEMGRQAYRDGKTRLGSHHAPCRLAGCTRAACEGYLMERHASHVASGTNHWFTCEMCDDEMGDVL